MVKQDFTFNAMLAAVKLEPECFEVSVKKLELEWSCQLSQPVSGNLLRAYHPSREFR